MTHISGTRSLGDSRMDDSLEDIESFYEARPDPTSEDPYDDDFVMSRRRHKERAAEAFERDLAELRQKRRDMQDKMFDMIDITAEIQKAKSTLEGANTAFLRHATKFDNSELPEPEGMTLAEKIERNRKIQLAAAGLEMPQEKTKPKTPIFKWTKIQELDNEPQGLVQGICNRRARINSLIADQVLTNPSAVDTIAEEPLEQPQPAPKERTKKRRSFLKRKKSVSF